MYPRNWSRRFYKGENIFTPHKLHLYQRLNQAGWPHSKISTIYMLLTLKISIFYMLFDLNGVIISLLFQILIFYIFENLYSIKFDNAVNKK